jgi:hypothetical protein
MVLGTGLALASAASTSAYGAVSARRPIGRGIDAFLVDRTIPMPGRMASYVAARGRSMAVVGVDLDAAAHAPLMRVLADSSAIVGISSGATLFCLERLAWDHGFRLTQRLSRPIIGACWQDAESFLNGDISPSGPLSSVRTYSPSRTDGVLHSWLMQKPQRLGRS